MVMLVLENWERRLTALFGGQKSGRFWHQTTSQHQQLPSK
jgi:hypothetical protein